MHTRITIPLSGALVALATLIAGCGDSTTGSAPSPTVDQAKSQAQQQTRAAVSSAQDMAEHAVDATKNAAIVAKDEGKVLLDKTEVSAESAATKTKELAEQAKVKGTAEVDKLSDKAHAASDSSKNSGS